MATPPLTMNQQETLLLIAHDAPSGQYLKPIPSLVSRGLVIEVQVIVGSLPTFRPFQPETYYTSAPALQYRLTEEGFATVESLLDKQWDADAQKAEDTFRQRLRTARSRVHKPVSAP